MPGEMDRAENQESKPASLVSALSSAIPSSRNCIGVDASFPPSPSSGSDSITLCQNVLELHQPATNSEHVARAFALQFGCYPPPDSLVACPASCAMHAKIHAPSFYSASSLPESAASPLSSSVIFSSGNDVACGLPLLISSADKASPSRFQFMQSFVNTLLPQLKWIHSQSSSISAQEKFSAVRIAADKSLAISAGGNNIWSHALLRKLSNSHINKVGVKKSKRRKSSLCSGKIYASILRRNNGLYALRIRNCSRSSSFKGTNSQAFDRTSYQVSLGASAKYSSASSSEIGLSGRFSLSNSHAMRFSKSPYVHRMRRAMFKRHCGLFSYVKLLKKSRSVAKSRNVKAPCADFGNKASTAQRVPSISKEQIASLGGLVPGGRNMDVPLLFQETADYILSLQMQVEALQTLSHSVLL